jgi:hypothetical protein
MAKKETPKTKGAAVGAAYPQSSALPAGQRDTFYPVPRIGSTEYAARIIAARFDVSPVIAGAIVSLAGIGGEA